MLEARTVAVVGASERAGSFGWRMTSEVARSPGPVEMFPVNPRYDRVLGRACVPSLDDLPEPVDLVLLGVRDEALEAELGRAAARGRPVRRHLRQRPRPRRAGGTLVAGTARGHRPGSRDGVVRRRLHGLRQSRARAPGDRLPRARSTAQRPGRVRQPLRFRILGVAQDPPAARLHARGLLGPGARHAGRLVYRLRARPPRHWHRGAAPRGPAGARGVAVGARPRGRGRYPGRGAHGRRFAHRPRHGGCPLGRPRRGRRGLGGPVRRLRGHQGQGSRRDDRHARALRRRQAGLDHIGRDRDRDGARFGSRARARRRRRRRARRPVRTDLRDDVSPPCRHHRPRPRARQSSRRVGHRSRLPAGAHVVARRSGGGRCRRRGRRLPRPRAGARRRHRQRARRDRRLQLDDQARGSAGQSAQCDQPRGGGAAAGGRRPGASRAPGRACSP